MKEKQNHNRGRMFRVFAVTLLLALVVLAVAAIKTALYNRALHRETFEGAALFSPENEAQTGVTVVGVARGSTWTKLFDFHNEGLTENNYQAYTYDFTVSNNTKDEVSDFSFKLTFGNTAYLASAWNGALEIHQLVADCR